MSIRWTRIVIAAVAAEVLGFVALLALVPVALGNFSTIGNAQILLQSAGLWIGTIAGFLFCLLGGWWAGRKSNDRPAHGFRVGALAGVLELILLLIAGAPFGVLIPMFVGGRIAGGYAGGRLARPKVAASAA